MHLLPWSIFVLLASSEAVGLIWGFFSRADGSIFFPVLYGTALGAVIFYLNLYHLIPKFFSQNKKLKYWAYGFLLVLLVCLLETVIDISVLTYRHGSQENGAEGQGDFWVSFVWVFANTTVANVACWIFAFAYRFPKDWIENERQKNQLEKDKLRSELGFLKAQINPHFLFNGINSIYHLIGADNDLAKETLLQFSGLLRYQLYECNVSFIPLTKELDYLKSYVKIEEVRKGEDAMFDIKFPDEDEKLKPLKIAPLLISPFLENSFKYLSHNSDSSKNYVRMQMMIDGENKFRMVLVNSCDPKIKKKPESNGGIGLVNVKRRLNLIYPDKKHELEIVSSEHKFEVDLMIDLNEN
ncbi:sensor histidine kinase [Flagellimonas nanhaiensis]|nr:histidine kinase [Allomuricauda nanhaiensis]